MQVTSKTSKFRLLTILALCLTGCASDVWYFRPSLSEESGYAPTEGFEYALRGQDNPGTVSVACDYTRLERSGDTSIVLLLDLNNGGETLEVEPDSFVVMTPGATRYRPMNAAASLNLLPDEHTRFTLHYRLPNTSPEDFERFRLFWSYRTGNRLVKESTLFVKTADRTLPDTGMSSSDRGPAYQRRW